MKRIVILFILACLACTASATTYTRYVDTGSAGGDGTTNGVSGATAAYASLSACEDAMDGVLGAGDTINIHCNRTNGGGKDTTAVTFLGWNASVASITITQDDFPATGVWDDAAYVLQSTNVSALTDRCKNLAITHLQIEAVETSTNDARGIYLHSDATGTLDVSGCLIKGTCSGTGSARGIYSDNVNATATISNTIISGFYISGDSGFLGIQMTANGPMTFLQCVVTNCYIGLRNGSAAGVLTVTNCAVFNNTDDFLLSSGTTNITNCASDDGDGTNPQDFTAEATDWAKVFNDYANGDFSLKDYSTSPCCKDTGAVPTPATDILGNTWTTNDIGAFAAPAATTSIIPLLRHHRD